MVGGSWTSCGRAADRSPVELDEGSRSLATSTTGLRPRPDRGPCVGTPADIHAWPRALPRAAWPESQLPKLTEPGADHPGDGAPIPGRCAAWADQRRADAEDEVGDGFAHH